MGNFNNFNKCDRCGSVNPASARYCYQCNNDLAVAATPTICAKCGTANSTVANFCKRCGNKLAKMQSTKRCPLCSAINPMQANVCMNCRFNFITHDEEPQSFYVQPVKTVTQNVEQPKPPVTPIINADFARNDEPAVRPAAAAMDVEQLVRQEIEKLTAKQRKEDEIKKLTEDKQKAEEELERLRRAKDERLRADEEELESMRRAKRANDDPAAARAAAAAKAEVEAAKAEAEKARKEAERIKMESERQAAEREAVRIKEEAMREAAKIKEEAEAAKAEAAKAEKEAAEKAAAAKAKARPTPPQGQQRPRDPRAGGDPRARDPRMGGPRPNQGPRPGGPAGPPPQVRPAPAAAMKPPEPKKRSPLPQILSILLIIIVAYFVLLPSAIDFASLGIFAMEAKTATERVNATGYDLIIYSLSTFDIASSSISQGSDLFMIAGFYVLVGILALIIYLFVSIIRLIAPPKKGGIALGAAILTVVTLLVALVVGLYDVFGLTSMRGDFTEVSPGWVLWLIPVVFFLLTLLNSTKKAKEEPMKPGAPVGPGAIPGGPMPPQGAPRPGGPMPPPGGPRPGGPMPPPGGPMPPRR